MCLQAWKNENAPPNKRVGWSHRSGAGQLLNFDRECTVAGGGSVNPFYESMHQSGYVKVAVSASEGGYVGLTAGGGALAAVFRGVVTTKAPGTISAIAVANPGYVFTGWADAPNAGFARTVHLNAEGVSLRANFEEKKRYTLDLEIEGCGSVKVTPAKKYYAEGEEVRLTAKACEDYFFKEWEGDVECIATGECEVDVYDQPAINIVFNKNTKLKATFIPLRIKTVAIAANNVANLNAALAALQEWNGKMVSDDDGNFPQPPCANWDVRVPCRYVVVDEPQVNPSVNANYLCTAPRLIAMLNPYGMPRSADDWLIVCNKVWTHRGPWTGEVGGAFASGVAIVPAQAGDPVEAPLWALIGHELGHAFRGHTQSHLDDIEDDYPRDDPRYYESFRLMHAIMNEDLAAVSSPRGIIWPEFAPWFPAGN